MAPKLTRTSPSKKNPTKYKSKINLKRCQQQRKHQSSPDSIPFGERSTVPVKPATHCDSLLLLHLNQLKNLFSNPHPQPTARENSALKMNKLHRKPYLRCSQHKSKSVIPPTRYTSSHPPRPRDLQSKVYGVVSAAIQYGFANNVLERKGDCFAFKNSVTKFNRAPTPIPRYCERCFKGHRCITGCPKYYLDRCSCTSAGSFNGPKDYRGAAVEKTDRRYSDGSTSQGSPFRYQSFHHLKRSSSPSRILSNYGNGVGNKSLHYKDYKKGKKENIVK